VKGLERTWGEIEERRGRGLRRGVDREGDRERGREQRMEKRGGGRKGMRGWEKGQGGEVSLHHSKRPAAPSLSSS
jgi:hypothetical protein